MVMAATPRVSPESSSARPGTLKRKLAAVAGAAGAAAIGASDAQAVPYTPTAGIAAAQGIPGFSFVDASNVTLGALNLPAAGSPGINWDVDGSGTANFVLSRSGTTTSRALGRLTPVAGGVLGTQSNPNFLLGMATGAVASAAKSPWRAATIPITYNGSYGTLMQPNVAPAGQFGFRLVEGADTFYGWASLSYGGVGQGVTITEAYYNTTPGAAISVGQVPQVVPEPSSMALLGLGAAGVAAWRARRKSQATAESQAQ